MKKQVIIGIVIFSFVLVYITEFRSVGITDFNTLKDYVYESFKAFCSFLFVCYLWKIAETNDDK